MALRRLIPAGVLLALLALPAFANAAGPSSYVVVYRHGVTDPGGQTSERERDLGFQAGYRFRYAVKGFSGRLTPAQVASLRADPAVESVVPDGPVHAFGAPVASGETVPAGLRRTAAVNGTTAREASGAAVAVIDTGIALSNPDLNAGAGYNCIGGGAPVDDNGHGTHVAGTIAARNDGARVVGVAPGTRVIAVKVLDSSGGGTISSVICGIDWVTGHAAALGIRVANMSLGGSGDVGSCTDGGMRQAICASTAAGVAYVVAAGNGHALVDSSGPQPANFPEVLTVTAMADSDGLPGGLGGNASCGTQVVADDAVAPFSNWVGPADVAHTIAAPGVCIVSDSRTGGTLTMSGTSMATPHVAGALALCFDENGTPGPCAGQTPSQAIQTLRGAAAAQATPANGFSGDPLRPVSGRYYGYLLSAAPAPAGASGDPLDVQNHSARLTGTVDGRGGSSTWHFEYGTGSLYGSQTPDQPVPAGPGPVERTIGGLLPGTAYHYRLVATGGGWTARGADKSFTTTGDPPPKTQIDSGPPGLTTDTSAAFTFSVTGLSSGIQCRLDTGAWTACTSPVSYAALKDGTHRFDARGLATDGTPDPTPAFRRWTVDTTPPKTTITSGPADPTSSTSASFAYGASEPGVTFRCRLDSGTWSSCDGTSAYSGLALGAHTFEVRATDPAGNVEPVPAVFSWTIVVPPPQAGPAAVSPAPALPALAAPDLPAAPMPRPAQLLLVRVPTVLPGARRVRIGLACKGAGACRGQLRVVSGGRARSSWVARALFDIPGDRRAVVLVPLPLAVQREFRADRALLVRVTAIVSGSERRLTGGLVRLHYPKGSGN